MSAITITNRFAGSPEWLPAATCDFDAGRSTHIWRISIPGNLHKLDEYSALINDAEHDRANRYHQLHDRQRFIISRGILRLLLGKYTSIPAIAIAFQIGANKKPFIQGSSVHYNVSHSGDMIVIAVSAAETGIDIEWVNPNFDYQDIIAEYFSETEAGFIKTGDSRNRFFLLWTRKEALIKATAKGLDDDLHAIPAMDGSFEVAAGLVGTDTDLQVSSFSPQKEYIASAASAKTAIALKFYNWG